jgi:hypothetical protein
MSRPPSASKLMYKAATELQAENERLRAEVERLKEAGVGYSQQTVDAITKERDALRAQLADTYSAETVRLLRAEVVECRKRLIEFGDF